MLGPRQFVTNTVMTVYQQVLPEFPLDECFCDFNLASPNFFKTFKLVHKPELPALDRSLSEQARG